MIEFIFMLTHNDQTVPDALDVYGTLRDTDLRYVGFKDIGLPPARLRELADAIRADGREVFLEVVSERAEDELRSVTAALDIGVDWLLGGTHPDEALAVLDQVGPPGTPGRPRYCPFPGRVVDHPSILEGTVDEIAESARDLTARDGVDGLDLLAYRWTGDVPALVRAVVGRLGRPGHRGRQRRLGGAHPGARRRRRVGLHHRWRHLRSEAPGGPERPRASRLRAGHDGGRSEGRWSPTVPDPSVPRTRAEPRPHRTTWRRTDDQRTRSRRDHPPRHRAPLVAGAISWPEPAPAWARSPSPPAPRRRPDRARRRSAASAPSAGASTPASAPPAAPPWATP